MNEKLNKLIDEYYITGEVSFLKDLMYTELDELKQIITKRLKEKEYKECSHLYKLLSYTDEELTRRR